MSQTLANGRFSLNDTGELFWQIDASNPLPGEVVGKITKGSALLSPSVQVQDPLMQDGAQDFIAIHTRSVLEGLFTLLQVEGEGALSGSAVSIGQKLFDNLGVMHRSQLEDDIAALDADSRRALRSKGVRLGPVLVFLPALIKPAAIRLRALLWGVWHDKTLPMTLPHDGRVSEVVDVDAVDRGFLRMIGYPVFGPRAIRIDMLDRVVTDIYDTADKGVFEAKHKYAEWLGCGLDDLHATLESMGHRKLRENAATDTAAVAPSEGADADKDADVSGEVAVVAEAVVVAPEADVSVEAVVVSEVAEQSVEGEVAKVEGNTEGAVEGVDAVLSPAAKPVIVAKFYLKRGKMSDRPQSRKPEGARDVKRDDNKTANGKGGFKPRTAYDPNRPQGRADGKREDKRDDRPRKPKHDAKRERQDTPRTYTFESKKAADDANNPFAILKQLQK